MTEYRFANVDDHRVFYRQAGNADRPAVLLLHGFPTSSHMFRNLIPQLAEQYHVTAPDLPGFGLTESPARGQFSYSFDNLAKVIERFTEVIGLKKFAIYVFDYGAPVGWRLFTSHPERISAIISQNGNAYEEGLSDGWNPIRKYWLSPTEQNRDALREFLQPASTKWQYEYGVSDPGLIAPEAYLLDSALLARPGNSDIQLDLFLDYQNNIAQYPALHRVLAKVRPPLLAVWGRNDPFFLPAGAEQFKRDVPAAAVNFFDTGHFALETHWKEIGDAIKAFLTGVK